MDLCGGGWGVVGAGGVGRGEGGSVGGLCYQGI